jgi:hypothetical protein
MPAQSTAHMEPRKKRRRLFFYRRRRLKLDSQLSRSANADQQHVIHIGEHHIDQTGGGVKQGMNARQLTFALPLALTFALVLLLLEPLPADMLLLERVRKRRPNTIKTSFLRLPRSKKVHLSQNSANKKPCRRSAGREFGVRV